MNIAFESFFGIYYREGTAFYEFEHSTHELVYYLNGEGVTTVNGVEYAYGPHMICFTKVGDIKSNVCTKKTDYVCIRFECPVEELDMIGGVYTGDVSKLMRLFNSVAEEVKAKEYNYYNLCNLYTAEILYKLARTNVINIKDEAFYKLIREIDSTLLFDRSIQDMANSVSYSYDHFRHKFKELTGAPPVKYIISKRIDNACRLLQENNHSCTEVSLMCGFSSSAQFSTLFKKVIGITPLEYKKAFPSN